MTKCFKSLIEQINDETFILIDKSTFINKTFNSTIETVAKSNIEHRQKSQLKQRFRYLHDEWKPSKEN